MLVEIVLNTFATAISEIMRTNTTVNRSTINRRFRFCSIIASTLYNVQSAERPVPSSSACICSADREGVSD